MKNPLTPGGFLQVGGVVLIIVGLLSYILPGGSLLGNAWWFDGTEGVVHILLGVVAIAASYVLGADLQRTLTIVVGVVALLFGILGFFLPQGPLGSMNIGPANLESPMDNILHLFVAAWALYSALGARRETVASRA